MWCRPTPASVRQAQHVVRKLAAGDTTLRMEATASKKCRFRYMDGGGMCWRRVTGVRVCSCNTPQRLRQVPKKQKRPPTATQATSLPDHPWAHRQATPWPQHATDPSVFAQTMGAAQPSSLAPPKPHGGSPPKRWKTTQTSHSRALTSRANVRSSNAWGTASGRYPFTSASSRSSGVSSRVGGTSRVGEPGPAPNREAMRASEVEVVCRVGSLARTRGMQWVISLDCRVAV